MTINLIILDRDGVLNQDRTDYVKTLDELVMIEGAAEAVAKINQAGIKVAVATNQSCIGKGIISEQQLGHIHDAINVYLKKHNAHIDLWLHCPDNFDSPRRKPAAGMLLEAMDYFNIRPKNTIFVGDALRDLQAAQAANCKPVLVKTGKGAETIKSLPPSLTNVSVCTDLKNVVELFLDNLN